MQATGFCPDSGEKNKHHLDTRMVTGEIVRVTCRSGRNRNGGGSVDTLGVKDAARYALTAGSH